MDNDLIVDNVEEPVEPQHFSEVSAPIRYICLKLFKTTLFPVKLVRQVKYIMDLASVMVFISKMNFS
jgi:hypothetical protein